MKNQVIPNVGVLNSAVVITIIRKKILTILIDIWFLVNISLNQTGKNHNWLKKSLLVRSRKFNSNILNNEGLKFKADHPLTYSCLFFYCFLLSFSFNSLISLFYYFFLSFSTQVSYFVTFILSLSLFFYVLSTFYPFLLFLIFLLFFHITLNFF